MVNWNARRWRESDEDEVGRGMMSTEWTVPVWFSVFLILSVISSHVIYNDLTSIRYKIQRVNRSSHIIVN